MYDLGRCYVLAYPDSKRPIGADWQTALLTADEVRRRREKNPANVGILLGPTTGICDLEGDSPEAEETYQRLCGDVVTPSWSSTRGTHRLFQFPPELAQLGAAFHLDGGLELRLGTKAAQSIIPPSIVDGVKRTWTVPPTHCQLAKLPQAIIELALNAPRAARQSKSPVDLRPQAADVERIVAYCRRVGISLSGTHERPDGTVILDLCCCPFKPDGHTDGDAGIIIDAMGDPHFHCFHASCVGNKWKQIEEAFGELRPTIRVTTRLDKMVGQAIAALSQEPNVYDRGGVLVEVVDDPERPPMSPVEPAPPKLRPIPAATLAVKLASCCKFEKFEKSAKDWVPTTTPKSVVDGVISSPTFPHVRKITGIVTFPILRLDGSIAKKPGYDEQTGLYLAIDENYPPLPTIEEAVATLDDIIADFPFFGGHKACWYSALLTVLCRSAITGCTPFHLSDANVSGSGKTLCLDVIATILEGCCATKYAMPRESDELRKLITAAAVNGSPYLLFDNISGKLGGPVLEPAITSTRWTDRLLATNKKLDLPLLIAWQGTANNCTLTTDMARRTLPIRLESQVEDPSSRTGFKHSKLLAYVKQHRRKLLMAALAIPKHFIDAGRPKQDVQAWGSFEEWAAIVQQALVWAKIGDPVEVRPEYTQAADEETGLLRQLVEAWIADIPSENGEPKAVTVGDVVSLAENNSAPNLTKVLDELDGDKRRALGNVLKRARRRIVNGWMFERTDAKRPEWRLIPAVAKAA